MKARQSCLSAASGLCPTELNPHVKKYSHSIGLCPASCSFTPIKMSTGTMVADTFMGQIHRPREKKTKVRLALANDIM